MAPAATAAPAQAVTVSAPKGWRVNPFRSVGGAWIWSTRKDWKTTLWHAKAGALFARKIAVIETRNHMGLEITYTVSPDGKWLIYHPYTFASAPFGRRTSWSLLNLHSLNRRVIHPPTGANLNYAYWINDRNACFYAWKAPGSGHHYPEFLLDVTSGRIIGNQLQRRAKLEFDAAFAPRRRKLDTLKSQWPDLARGYSDGYVYRGGLGWDSAGWGGSQFLLLRSGDLVKWDQYQSLSLFPPGRAVATSMIGFKDTFIMDAWDLGDRTVLFCRQRFDLSRGVGSAIGDWDNRIHDSRSHHELCRWDLSTGKVELLGEGSMPIRIGSSGRTPG